MTQEKEQLFAAVLRAQRLSNALAGAAMGLAGAWVLSRFLEDMLFEVSATDPMTFGLWRW